MENLIASKAKFFKKRNIALTFTTTATVNVN